MTVLHPGTLYKISNPVINVYQHLSVKTSRFVQRELPRYVSGSRRVPHVYISYIDVLILQLKMRMKSFFSTRILCFIYRKK